MNTFHWCRECDVKWHGDATCWACDRQVTAWGAPKKKEEADEPAV